QLTHTADLWWGRTGLRRRRAEFWWGWSGLWWCGRGSGSVGRPGGTSPQSSSSGSLGEGTASSSCPIVVEAPHHSAAGRVPTAKESPMAPIDLPLLMTDTVRGKRSAVTCALKCASQCAFGPCNHSDNPTFRDIASSALSRRTGLGGSTAAL